MTAILFISLFFFFLSGVPIAFSIALSSLVAFVFHGDLPPVMIIQRLYAGVDSFPLLAVPLFMLAGFLMESGGISRRVIEFAEALVGWLPGGLTAVTIVAAMFFAGISGSAAADAAAVGSIMIPAMVSRGYDPRLAGAVMASGGSLGVVIPPSIPMIIFGFLTGASVGKLFVAGIIPGLMIGISLMTLSVLISWKEGIRETIPFSWRRLVVTFWEAKWALGAPVVILGGILGGVFTATEAAAVATFYALIVGLFIHKELRWKDLPSLVIRGCLTASTILFIIATASVFSWLMAIEDIPARIASGILSITRDRTLLLLMINALLLAAGTFVETTAALILLVPVITPLLPSLNMDIIQLGVVVVVNLAIGMLTPPLGICLLVSCSIANIRLDEIIRRIGLFLMVLILNLILITYWEPLTLWLPSMMD
ncbi:TRAP transporter large permease [Thermodesulforhabdus norvegica]|uniref:TRAP transporter, DctM subunit n=1 Tax=Thermodesulforhabdus norvegica TaxID=39841 RepID=A0A1I4QRD7_9BACT|nr:TRAP transporter large permease [Thermodesulforhabdus norvegica]SFM42609.1 TRAP transporter, DctM subunit [Thermodesulforhabdus norvegica]